jgi:hypothetical protein
MRTMSHKADSRLKVLNDVTKHKEKKLRGTNFEKYHFFLGNNAQHLKTLQCAVNFERKKGEGYHYSLHMKLNQKLKLP